MSMIKEHPLLLFPLGMTYILIGIVVGIILRYKTEYHIRRFGDRDEHGFCWCADHDFRNVVRSWINASFIAWPINLAVSFVIKPIIKLIMIPLFKFILIPVFVFVVVGPVKSWQEYYKKATEMASNRARFEVQEEERALAERHAEELDKKKHAGVDGAMARADALLKRVDDRVGGSEEE